MGLAASNAPRDTSGGKRDDSAGKESISSAQPKDESLSINKQAKSRSRKQGANLYAATIENLKTVRPDEWNNVPIPVTEAIKVLVNEVAILNSRMNTQGKEIDEFKEAEQKHYSNNLNAINNTRSELTSKVN